MSVLRLFAVMFIFGAASLAWIGLGGAMTVRTEKLDESLSREMADLWGPKVLVQQAPFIAPASGAGPSSAGVLAPAASTISADIDHANRYKGLLWYSTFTVKFHGKYSTAALPAVDDKPASGPATKSFFTFLLPTGITTYYEQPRVTIDGRAFVPPPGEIAAGRLSVPIDRVSTHVIEVTYSTGAQDAWLYSPSSAGEVHSRDGTVSATGGAMSELNDFNLSVATNFAEIDYPKGTRSPTEPASQKDGGRLAQWRFGSAMTNQAMGVVMPRRLNAGPIAARMSFFAPVSLLFFFTAIFTVVVLRQIPLHPMHYLLLAAGFFAFHILMAYLVDLVNIHAAFWICAAVSVVLVVSYLRLVVGVKFAVAYAGMAQLVFLVGFSYAFFWTGYTGLTITVGAIIMLFVIMQATGKVNWAQVFNRRPRAMSATIQPSPIEPPPIPPQNIGGPSRPDEFKPINVC